MSHLPRYILPFLIPFSILFHVKKSFIKFTFLFFGCLTCRAGVTICGCLRALGMKGEKHFANYHHLLSQSKINLTQAAKTLISLVLPLTNFQMILVVDEHLERRKGNKIKAKAIYRDPVASSRKWKVKCFGLKWVVISLLVTFPWSKRPFALPVFCALRTPEDHPKNQKRKTRSSIDILCQMLCVIRRWFPKIPITIVGDGDFCRVKLCQVCKRLSINLVARMRTDCRLHQYPEIKKKGRQKKLGKRIEYPEQSLWTKVTVDWYGGIKKEVAFVSQICLWLAGKTSEVLELKAIWVKLRATDEMILMATAIDMQAVDIIRLYISRWNQEVTFRESRDYLGIETQRQWSDLAIARTTPLLFGLYTLVVLIGNAIFQTRGIVAQSTAWYCKTNLTFSDLLEAVREEIGDPTTIANSLIKTEFIKHPYEEEDICTGYSAAGF